VLVLRDSWAIPACLISLLPGMWECGWYGSFPGGDISLTLGIARWSLGGARHLLAWSYLPDRGAWNIFHNTLQYHDKSVREFASVATRLPNATFPTPIAVPCSAHPLALKVLMHAS
jgi:hypothetical protein